MSEISLPNPHRPQPPDGEQPPRKVAHTHPTGVLFRVY